MKAKPFNGGNMFKFVVFDDDDNDDGGGDGGGGAKIRLAIQNL